MKIQTWFLENKCKTYLPPVYKYSTDSDHWSPCEKAPHGMKMDGYFSPSKTEIQIPEAEYQNVDIFVIASEVYIETTFLF